MIAKRGHYGSHMQEDWSLIRSMIEEARKRSNVRITVKIRRFEDDSITIRYAKMLEKAGARKRLENFLIASCIFLYFVVIFFNSSKYFNYSWENARPARTQYRSSGLGNHTKSERSNKNTSFCQWEYSMSYSCQRLY